jgi:hypothetical protein
LILLKNCSRRPDSSRKLVGRPWAGPVASTFLDASNRTPARRDGLIVWKLRLLNRGTELLQHAMRFAQSRHNGCINAALVVGRVDADP